MVLSPVISSMIAGLFDFRPAVTQPNDPIENQMIRLRVLIIDTKVTLALELKALLHCRISQACFDEPLHGRARVGIQQIAIVLIRRIGKVDGK